MKVYVLPITLFTLSLLLFSFQLRAENQKAAVIGTPQKGQGQISEKLEISGTGNGEKPAVDQKSGSFKTGNEEKMKKSAEGTWGTSDRDETPVHPKDMEKEVKSVKKEGKFPMSTQAQTNGDEKGKHEKTKSIPILLKNDEQRDQCSAYIPRLKENFHQARYYSVHGDACNTARFSEQFLALVEASKKICPDNFLETNGYSARIIHNIDLLKELGLKRCLEPERR